MTFLAFISVYMCNKEANVVNSVICVVLFFSGKFRSLLLLSRAYWVTYFGTSFCCNNKTHICMYITNVIFTKLHKANRSICLIFYLSLTLYAYMMCCFAVAFSRLFNTYKCTDRHIHKKKNRDIASAHPSTCFSTQNELQSDYEMFKPFYLRFRYCLKCLIWRFNPKRYADTSAQCTSMIADLYLYLFFFFSCYSKILFKQNSHSHWNCLLEFSNWNNFAVARLRHGPRKCCPACMQICAWWCVEHCECVNCYLPIDPLCEHI